MASAYPIRTRAAGAARLVAISAGLTLPALLLGLVVGNPLPAWPIDWDAVIESVRYGLVPPEVWIRVLAVAAWLAWSALVVMLATEVLTVVRDRPSPTGIPSWVRRLAQVVVSASIALTGPTPTTTSTGQPVLVAAVAPTSPVTHGEAAPAPALHGGRLVTVAEGDSWAGFAADTLGDASLGPALRDANAGRVVDGDVVGADTAFVEPGWVLAIPAELDTRGSVTGPAITANHDDMAVSVADEVTVEPGEHFWSIAEDTLTESWGRPPSDAETADYWDDLVDANRDRLLPPRDPDLIYPGQELAVPPLPADPRLPEAQDRDPGVPQPQDSSEPVDPAAGEADLTTEMPYEVAVPDPAVEPRASVIDRTPPGDARVEERARSRASGGTDEVASPAPSTPNPERRLLDRDVQRDAAQAVDDTSDTLETVALVAASGLALAGTVATLDRRRRIRRRRRAAGERIPLPEGEPATLEHRVRGLVDRTAAAELDAAIRDLATRCEQDGRAIPRVLLASVSTEAIAVHLAEADPAPPVGWQVDDHARTWSRRREGNDETAVRHGWPQGVLLASVGATLDGERRVLLNLAQPTLVGVTGVPAARSTLIRQIVVELATTDHADVLDIVVCGADASLTCLERIQAAPTAAEAVQVLRKAAASAGAEDGVALGVFLDPLDSQDFDELRTLAESGNGGLAVLLGSAPEPVGTTLHASPDQVVVQPSDLVLAPLDLDLDGIDQLETVLVEATTASDAASTASVSELLHTEAVVAAGSGEGTQGVQVRLLGPVEVSGCEDFETRKAEELVAFLALHREGADADTLMEALWPREEPSLQRFRTVAWRARRALGEDEAGQLLLPRASNGRYRLADSVVVDYEVFVAHVADAEGGDDPANRLRAALELVRGRPLSATPDEYGWAIHLQHVIEQAIGDAAHDLAQRCLAKDRSREAAWAAEQGLLADPYFEVLYRDLMEAAAAAGNTTELPAIMNRLRRLMADDADVHDGDDYLDPATIEMYRTLRARAS